MRELAKLLFPNITQTPQDIFPKYPPRKQKVVTRIAPSPTGFLHIGAVYSAMLDKIVAYKWDGVFFLRIEDTDQKREVQGARELYIKHLKNFWLEFDEGPLGEDGADVGSYGPYIQSKREEIYQIFIKDLVEKWLAYPCFLSEEEITDTRSIQEASKVPTGIYGEYSPWRFASLDEVKKALDENKEFVIRLRSSGEITKKREVSDLVKGSVSIQENFLDIVICKKTGIPTYHFAHLIDDHLMGTTHVIRSDEWFASLPLHLELFEMMGWKAPLYAHYGPLVKLDGESRRKLSKRKDPEADVEYFFQKWYFVEAILDFLSNIINAWFEDWRKQNPEKNYLEYDFSLQKVNSSGALVDMDKLNFVNAQYIKQLDTWVLFESLSVYLEKYENNFFQNTFLKFDRAYNFAITKELQSRLQTLSEYIELTGFFYNNFEINDAVVSLLMNEKMKIDSLDIVKKWLKLALETIGAKITQELSFEEKKNIFLESIKNEWLKNGQVLWPVRVALSGEAFSPWAFELIEILWIQKSREKIQKVLQFLEK